MAGYPDYEPPVSATSTAPLALVDDRTIAAGGSASESFDVTGLTMVRVLFAGFGERNSTLAALYMTLNANVGSVYSTNAAALTTQLTLGNVPGSLTNTDRFGYCAAEIHLLSGQYKSGFATCTAIGSTAAVGQVPGTNGLFSTITAAVTSMEITMQLGDIGAGSRIIVMGA
jgi:hypothetical protein